MALSSRSPGHPKNDLAPSGGGSGAVPEPEAQHPSVSPAVLARDADGTPVSPAYGDIYHSADGGPGQARHVFLSGNGLPQRWAGQDRCVILENGFGTGLNFLATWAAWRDASQRPARLHYLATENAPFRADDLAQLHAAWPELADLAAELRRAWPVLTPGFHRIELDQGRVALTLMLGEAETSLRRLEARVDAFYLDGFDPRRNPAMWSPSLCKRLARLAAPEATLATWCVAGSVREGLHAAGFVTEKRPGFGRKREMLTGFLPQRGRAAHAESGPGEGNQALILGAGLAGCALAERLAARGWRVEVLERHAAPGQEASGNLAGIARPLLSRDDNIASRLNRACFLHLPRAFAALEAAGQTVRRGFDGVLQVARDAVHETRQREMAESWPADFVRFVEREEASRLLGWPAALGGWWFPGGGWCNPPGACRAWLAAGGDAVRFRPDTAIAALERRDGRWHALDAAGRSVAAAPVLILATGAATRLLAPDLPANPVRGQVSHVPAGVLPVLPHAACCEGYLTPAVDGIHCLGASYAYDEEKDLREEEHAGNLVRLRRILPGAGQDIEPARLGGRVGFRAATPDRLPLAGALPESAPALAADARLRDIPRQEGLYGLLGLGSRGLVWAALAAEIVASRLHGDPMPIENDLLEAIDPARFLLRRHRRG
ncbi:MAG: bifunctional tRNA (5-methylaminomethyl-2-thiouridine)(34)-methyltransferase MnmD/FAD-dependent 5-carboxymethylaminomethyl-2-thiouridine(34) oxidoreductase MnmC [Betaproteobacteria bacterium]|nr:bifunctional tRNA (5-methylaminomethyl-2-thiouridine)(34)-methyltransferase MnmD/FAD-dependent 5-carboxymethylaminomethyl-2-thiouridine(34) oxidoreductase MnmC [Betaproteobacteria bacterium]